MSANQLRQAPDERRAHRGWMGESHIRTSSDGQSNSVAVI